MEYTDVHRALLQKFMLSRTLAAEDATEEFQMLMDTYSTRRPNGDQFSLDDLQEAVLAINEKLHQYHMEMQIRKRKYVEMDGKVYFGLVTTRKDAISQLGSAWKTWQVDVLRCALTEIQKSGDGFVDYTTIVRMGSRMHQSIGASRIDEFITQMVRERWLQEGMSSTNTYTVGIRTMMELETLMRDLGAPSCIVNGVPVIKTSHYKRWLESHGVRTVKEEPQQATRDASPDPVDAGRRSRRPRRQVQSSSEESSDESDAGDGENGEGIGAGGEDIRTGGEDIRTGGEDIRRGGEDIRPDSEDNSSDSDDTVEQKQPRNTRSSRSGASARVKRELNSESSSEVTDVKPSRQSSRRRRLA